MFASIGSHSRAIRSYGLSTKLITEPKPSWAKMTWIFRSFELDFQIAKASESATLWTSKEPRENVNEDEPSIVGLVHQSGTNMLLHCGRRAKAFRGSQSTC